MDFCINFHSKYLYILWVIFWILSGLIMIILVNPRNYLTIIVGSIFLLLSTFPFIIIIKNRYKYRSVDIINI